MTFLCANGRKKKIKNVSKYLIDWDAKCRSGIQKSVKIILKNIGLLMWYSKNSLLLELE